MAINNGESGLSVRNKINATISKADANELAITAAETKLAGIEAGADVTDATNVAAAGALMASNNLSDLADAATARSNLGISSGIKLTKTFFADEEVTITSPDSLGAPFVSVTKEVASLTPTLSSWSLQADANNLTSFDSAPAEDLIWSDNADMTLHGHSELKIFDLTTVLSSSGLPVNNLRHFAVDDTGRYLVAQAMNGTTKLDAIVLLEFGIPYEIETLQNPQYLDLATVYPTISSANTNRDITVKLLNNGNNILINRRYGTGGDSIIIMLELGIANDLSTVFNYTEFGSYTGNSRSYFDVWMNPTGDRLFVTDDANDAIVEYQLGVPFDLSTSSFVVGSTDFGAPNLYNMYNNNNPTVPGSGSQFFFREWDRIQFNQSGTKLYLSRDFDSGWQLTYDLSVPFDVTTLSYNNRALNGTYVPGFGYLTNSPNAETGYFSADGVYCFSKAANPYFTSPILYRFKAKSMLAALDTVGSYSFTSADNGKFIKEPTSGFAFKITGDNGEFEIEYASQDRFISDSLLAGLTDLALVPDDPILLSGEWELVGLKYDAPYNPISGVPFVLEGTDSNLSVAITKDINTDYWTKIISSSAGGSKNVPFLLSTDSGDTWVAPWNNNLPPRNVVRNNSGTWEYNSDVSNFPLDEAWTVAPTNSMEGALTAALNEPGLPFYESFGLNFAGIPFLGTQGTEAGDAYLVDDTNIFVAEHNAQVGTSSSIVQYTGTNPYGFSNSVIHRSIGGGDLFVGFSFENEGLFRFEATGGDFFTSHKIRVDRTDVGPFQYAYNGGAYPLKTITTTYVGVPKIRITGDGTKVIVGKNAGQFDIFNFSQPFNSATCSSTSNAQVDISTDSSPNALGGMNQISGFDFDESGTQFIVMHDPNSNSTSKIARVYELTTPFDITTRNSTTFFEYSYEVNASPTNGAANYINNFHLSDDGSFVASGQDVGGNLPSVDLSSAIYEFKQYNRIFNINSMSNGNVFQPGGLSSSAYPSLSSTLKVALGVSNSNITSPLGNYFYDFNLSYYRQAVDIPAVYGTDYTYLVPSDNSVVITALTEGNYKVKVF